MNIVFCTRNDINGNIALNRFLEKVKIEEHNIKVILSRHISQEEQSINELITYEFFECLLFDEIQNIIDLKTGLDSESELYTFNQLAEKYSITIEEKGKPGKNFIKFLKEFNTDIIISCRYDYIFKKEIIDIPEIGILNVHPGRLPEYRGVMAPFQALLNNDKYICVTVHWIDAGIDTGDIIKIYEIPNNKNKSVFDYYIELYCIGIEFVAELLCNINQGNKINSYKQLPGDYYKFPGEKDFIKFEQQGYKLIDYNNIIKYISRYYKI